MRTNLFIFTLFICTFSKAVEPGHALKFDGSATHANLQEALAGVRTISFWIKPNATINNTLSSKQAVLMRDNFGPGSVSPEKLGLYFEEAGNSDAGKMVFICSSPNSTAKIVSNQNTWQVNTWYHVAVIVHPSEGLKMYVNGILQNSTAAGVYNIYIRSEGPTGHVYLGKWGASSNLFLDAQLDEFKMWTEVRLASDIRANMCKVLSSIYPASLKAYLQFDNQNTSAVTSSNSGGSGGVLYNATAINYPASNAPVGQKSTYIYDSDVLGHSITFNQNYSITIDSIKAFPDIPKGVHIYYNYVPGMGNIPGTKGWFGVWFDVSDVDYNVHLDFSSMDNYCDSCSVMYSKEHRNIGSWSPRQNFANNCTFSQENENVVNPGIKQREEYTIIDTIKIEVGLPDTIVGCTGDFILLSPNDYPNATYIWNDSLVQKVISVTESGYHHVEISYHGCKGGKSVYVDIGTLPVFSLPNDTAICMGDTLWVTAPIDSADYSWGGLWTTRTIAITAAGEYPLTITKDKCKYTDIINVSIIPSFQINLGPDKELCLGESLSFNFDIPNVKFLWSDGDTHQKKEFFNQEGKFWLEAWNDCFTRVDTINISYEECDCHIYVPNSFSPNNDGINDMFFPVTSCFYDEFELDILDRWGNIVFRTKDVNQGWDGNFKGGISIQSTYSWRMRYKKFTWMRKSNYEYGVLTLIH